MIPLRILVTKQNDSPATIFLQTLHIELIGYTGLRAHELRRSEVTSWMIMSSSNMRLPLINVTGTETDSQALEIDSKLWSGRPLPSTVAPSFDTCNMSRSYALDIKVGLSWGTGKIINVCTTFTLLQRSWLMLSSPSLQFSQSECLSKSILVLLHLRHCSPRWPIDRPQGHLDNKQLRHWNPIRPSGGLLDLHNPRAIT